MKQKMNIAELLNSKRELTADMRVFSNAFTQELALIGFVPFNEFDLAFAYSLQINLNEDVIYTSYRIRLESLNLTLPVMKNIRIVADEEVFECQRKLITKYPIELFEKYYNDLEKCDMEETLKKRILKQDGERVLKNSNKYDMEEKRLYVDEDNKLTYHAQNNDIVLTRTHGEYTVISNEFACLCAYTNSRTGRPTYGLFSTEDLVKLSDKENES